MRDDRLGLLSNEWFPLLCTLWHYSLTELGIALAAIDSGKHVYCEKPLAPFSKDALEMTKAAEDKKIKTQVGFNYLVNPMFSLAKDIINSGELGEIYNFIGKCPTVQFHRICLRRPLY